MSREESYFAPVDFRIGQSPPENIPPELRGAFEEVYNAFNQIIRTLTDLCGIGSQNPANWTELAGNSQFLLTGNLRRLYVTLGEDIQYGAIISLYLDAGILKARNANATNTTKPGHGFCSTAGGGVTGDVIEVQLGGGLVTIGGVVIGDNYWLSTTDGIIQNGPPFAAGNIEQYVGVGVATDILFVNMAGWIRH